MALSVFDLFTIGIGPSSSHTVGPMRAARRFAAALEREQKLASTAGLGVALLGSLGATGRGHGSDAAIVLGLEGETPEGVDPDAIAPRMARLRREQTLRILGQREIAFSVDDHLRFDGERVLAMHPNGMIFGAFDASGASLLERQYYSVGGGFVVGDASSPADLAVPTRAERVPHPFTNGAELLALCEARSLSVGALMLDNEMTWRSESAVRHELAAIAAAMQDCVRRGCEREGVLPGGLKVRRRAPGLHERLLREKPGDDPLAALDWVNLWALAVNEENAAGGRVVTAPTNGAAGIVPAVLHYYARFVPGADTAGVARLLLVAGAIGMLYKMNASISGAEVGCQGEVGVACSMAAAGLTEALGGSPQQVENAAEIGMEHNLGLTCDPVAGLVQVPCIERNAMGAVKAINASRIALAGDGLHRVSLDRVIAVMRATGADMSTKYKETARGGLSVNVVEC
jgi:L-serine dehydratase